MAILVIVTVVGNSMTLVAFIIDKHLRTIYNTFIFNLALTDLIIGLISMPFYAVYTINGFHSLLEGIFCKVWFVTDLTLCTESVFTILFLSYDRLLLTRYGHRYDTRVTLMISIWKIVFSWIVAFLLWGPFVIYWELRGGNTTIPNSQCYSKALEEPPYAITTAVIEFLLPFLALLIISSVLYNKVRKMFAKRKTLICEEDTVEQTSLENVETFTEGNSTENEMKKLKKYGLESKTQTTKRVTDPSYEGSTTGSQTDIPANSIPEQHGKRNETAMPEKDQFVQGHIRNEEYSTGVIRSAGSENILSKEAAIKYNHESTIGKTHFEETIVADEEYSIEDKAKVTEGEEIDHDEEKSEDKKENPTEDINTKSSDILEAVLSVLRKGHEPSGLVYSSSIERLVESRKKSEEMETTEIKTNILVNDSEATPSGHGFERQFSLKEKKSVKRNASHNAGFLGRSFTTAHRVDSIDLDHINEEKSSKGKHREVDIDLAIRESRVTDFHECKKNIMPRERNLRKAAKYLAALLIVFFLCWAPYTSVKILENAFEIKFGKTVRNLSRWLLWLKSSINPFLYAYNSRRYRRHFKRFLPCCCSKL